MPLCHPKSILSNRQCKFLDGSWFLTDPKKAYQEYLQRRIPQSSFFDVDQCVQRNKPGVHVWPDKDSFQAYCQKIGLQNNDEVIVYDQQGMFSGARVYFLLKWHGHRQVSLMDGGLPEYLRLGGSLEEGEVFALESDYQVNGDSKDYIVDIDRMLRNIETKEAIVIDARSEDRFCARVPEPREGMRGGHIPNSINLPFQELLHQGKFKSLDELQQEFERRNIPLDNSRQIISSCGSGVTACIPLFALELLGVTNVALYDGSWSEWGSRSDTPIEKEC